VVGRFDAKKLWDRVANKTRKKVDLVGGNNNNKGPIGLWSTDRSLSAIQQPTRIRTGLALTGDGGHGGVEGHLLRPAVADERRVHVLGPSCD
jgi:hypothetical protein